MLCVDSYTCCGTFNRPNQEVWCPLRPFRSHSTSTTSTLLFSSRRQLSLFRPMYVALGRQEGQSQPSGAQIDAQRRSCTSSRNRTPTGALHAFWNGTRTHESNEHTAPFPPTTSFVPIPPTAVVLLLSAPSLPPPPAQKIQWTLNVYIRRYFLQYNKYPLTHNTASRSLARGVHNVYSYLGII